MIRLFTGFDAREAVGWHVFAQELIERSSRPVSIVALGAKRTERDGTNAFTYSRFLVPWLCRFEGFAIFVDGADMLVLADIAELWRLRNPLYAVQVVKHDYRTRHRRKYIGTELEADNFHYPRKNWSSVVVWNCEHPANARLTPDFVAAHGGDFLHRFGWLDDDEIGDLPPEWNVLVGEEVVTEGAKLLHYTLGIPGFDKYKDADRAEEWRAALARAHRGLQTHGLVERGR